MLCRWRTVPGFSSRWLVRCSHKQEKCMKYLRLLKSCFSFVILILTCGSKTRLVEEKNLKVQLGEKRGDSSSWRQAATPQNDTTQEFFRSLYLFATLLLLFFFSACDAPKQVVSPGYLTRVPRPLDLKAVQDTTNYGTSRVTVRWSVTDSANLKDFEIYRSVAGDYFLMIMAGRFFVYADTSIAWYYPEDSLQLLKYAVIPIGIDRYRGQSSDTLMMYMKKK